MKVLCGMRNLGLENYDLNFYGFHSEICISKSEFEKGG